ncbi:MAG: MerR family transcriptional regulator [Syntrophaceae bacterium]|nr:MerR family transcriptional regulator [Syntrophaceae bacterium]
MADSIPDKSYFRIGEVSKILQVKPYVVRFWESEFKTVRPARTGSDQRRYHRKDVEELLTIRRLLYEENYTINGARKQLRKKTGDLPQPSPPGPGGGSSPLVGGDERQALLEEIEQGLRQIRDLVG